MSHCFRSRIVTVFSIACMSFHASLLAQDDSQRAEQFRKNIYDASQAIPAPEFVGRNPDNDLEALEQLAPMREQLSALEKDFAKGIATGRQPFQNLAGTIQHVRNRLNEFEKSLKGYASLENIHRDAQHVRKMIAMSIENQAPAYFQPTSDIAIYTKNMERRIRALEKLGSPGTDVEKARSILKQLLAESKVAQEKLLDGILQQNKIPDDKYQKADRDELIQLIEATWNKAMPNQKPIRVGLIGNDWTRMKKWEIQNKTLYEVDRSKLQGFVLASYDDRCFVLRNIQLMRDHTDNGKLTAWTINDPSSPPSPIELILKEKVK